MRLFSPIFATTCSYAPREEIVVRHLDMMAFEEQILATPRFVQKRNRRPMPRPRRALIAFIAVFATLVSCGLSAAGALPAPLQHITDSIAHTFGVPHADHNSGAAHAAAPSAHTPLRPAATRTPTELPRTITTSVAPAPKKHAAVTKKKVSAPPTTTTFPQLPNASTQIAPPRPHAPSRLINPGSSGPKPSKNSSNTPPGFPTDWRTLATQAATGQLDLICPQATTLTPTACPQQAVAAGANAQAQGVVWTLLNQPYDGAVVVAKTAPGFPALHIPPSTSVTVYEAFQMEATYNELDGSGPYIAYSSGIGAATMTWNGTTFVDVSFSPGSVAGHLLPGVKPPTLPRPANVTDGVVSSAVQAAFNACTASTPAVGPAPSCPQPTVAGDQWTLSGDPLLGAVVSFSPQQGLFTVTGTYTMTSSEGESAGGPYTATLFFDGQQLQLLSLAAS